MTELPNIPGAGRKEIIKSLAFIMVHVVLGIGILVAGSTIKLPFGYNSSVAVFIVFLLLNISYARLFKLNTEIAAYWSAKKIIYLLPAMVCGAAIGLFPAAVNLLTGHVPVGQITMHMSVTFAGVVLSFIIVGWEELWFRGIFLNYCNRYLSAVRLSLIMGFLFMAVHVLNPEISLLRQGPALFFAGSLLTMVYFYYKTIWVPAGLHFGNNFFGDMVKLPDDHNIFFGGDGYLSAIILAVLFVFFVVRMRARLMKSKMSGENTR